MNYHLLSIFDNFFSHFPANELNRPDPEKVEARRRKYLYEKKYLEKNFGPNRIVSKDKSISETDKDNTTTTLYVNNREAEKSIAYNDENKPLLQSASILSDEERTNLSDEERLKLRESPANINLTTLVSDTGLVGVFLPTSIIISCRN